MAPVKISYTVGGKERESITAPDGVTAVLETPVGKAFAKMRPSKPNRLLDFLTDWFPKFGAQFPGENEMVYPGSKHFGEAGLKRSRTYSSEEGEIDIKAEGTKK